jgi:hypothetical protein
VSETFQNYSRQSQNAQKLSAFAGDSSEILNQLYVPRPTGKSLLTAFTSALVTPASAMLNQTTNGTLPVTIIKNYTGLGTGFNGTWTLPRLLPPDPVLGVGLTQLVQWVNDRLTVLDKATGSPLFGSPGYIEPNVIWANLGVNSVCANFNRGDPQVQYDRLAHRWVLSQFAFTSATGTTSGTTYPAAPFAQCVAVSQTNDATGAYNIYEYSTPNLPDYTKLAVWPDAYYTTDNAFTYNTATGVGSYAGTRICAYNRAALLAGSAATRVCFDLGSATDFTHFTSLASDFEGTILPPTNTAAYILNNDWFTKLTPPYVLQLRRFRPDFVNPANSTFNDGQGGAFNSYVSLPFDNSVIGSCGDNGGQCVPQPDGTGRLLDTLSMRPMHRLAYRNLGANRETLVFTQSVDPVGAAVAGIQLVEIRNPAANPPVIYNNVNFNPDATNRWMGSAASDKLGNVALGYSVSSTSIYPSIRIAGRLRNDIRNFVRGEVNVQNGSGSQTSSRQRWGDYSTMQIDPSDDCTFWYTGEYIVNTDLADWATRIAGFKFNNCK